jgi:hypothetical protein
MKMRNGANSAFISLWELDGTFIASDISLAAGSAAAPSLFFTGDTNTGLFSPGADTVALATAGSNRLHITSAGLVGIGTSSANGILEIRQDQAADTAFWINNRNTTASGATNSIIFGGYRDTDQAHQVAKISAIHTSDGSAGNFAHRGALAFYTQIASTSINPEPPTERMRIDATGRVGIGTTGPTEKLHVDGNILAGAGGQIMTVSGSAQYGTRTANSVLFLQNNGEAARIDADKRLLVGTSTGFANTTVQIQGGPGGTTDAAQLALSRGLAPASISSGQFLASLDFTANNGGKFATIEAYADATPGNNDYPGRLTFSTTADGSASPSEAMRIDSSGSVLIRRTGFRSGTTNACSLNVRGLGGDWTADFENPATTAANCYGIVLSYSLAAPNNTGNQFFRCSDSSAVRAEIRSNGGLANFSANNANLSDRNAKKDISPAADTWNCLKEWEIVNYRYKDQPDDADLNLGVIAQQVAESCPEVITIFQEAKEATDDAPSQDERLGVKEQQMYWMAIKALQEAQVRIEQLEAKVAALESA